MNPKPSFTFGRFRSKVNPSNIDKVKSELNKINLVNFLDKVPLKNKYGVFSDLFKYIINNHMPVLEKKKKQFTKSQNVNYDQNCPNLKNLSKLYFDRCKDEPDSK